MKILPFAMTALALLVSGCSSDDDATNQAPSVTLQNAYTGPENTDVTITADATDTDGSIASYQWEVTGGDAQIVAGEDSSAVTLALPAVSADAQVSLSLTVSDNDGASATTTTVVDVRQVEPVIEDIDAVSAAEKTTVTLTADASVTSGAISTYQWTQTSGPQAQLSGEDASALTITLPEVSSEQTATFDVTATDDDGDEVTTTASVTITQTTMSLAISGLATDSPLQNAEITVMLNGEDYMDGIVTDAQGNFTFNLVVDDSMGDAFVSIRAKGTGEQAAAGLISLLASFDSLVQDSGDDGELSAEDNPATTVSNITTAKYALLKKVAEDGQSVFDEKTVETLGEQVNPAEVITLATAIKVAIDKANSAQTTLPDDVPDTLALIEDEEATQAFVEEVKATPEFADAQEEIFDDPTLFATQADFGDEFVFYTLPESDLHAYAAVMHFFADGSGQDEVPFTWMQDGSSLVLTYDGSASSSFYPSIDGQQVLATTVPVSKTLTLISQNGNTLDFKQTSTYEQQYPENPELDTESYTDTWLTSVKTATSAIELTAPATVYIGIPTVNRDPIVLQDDEQARVVSQYEKFELAANGSAQAVLSGQTVNWALTDGVLTISGLELSAQDSAQFTVKQVAQRKGADILHTAHVDALGEPLYDYDKTVFGFLGDIEVTWTNDNVAGIYGYDTVLGESELNNFWFELKDDGRAYTVSTSDSNSDGILDESEVYVTSGGWLINSDGHLEITRLRNTETKDIDLSCFVESDVCGLYHRRTWELLALEDNVLTLAHTHDFKLYSFYDYENPSPDMVDKDIRLLRKNIEVPYDISTIIGQ